MFAVNANGLTASIIYIDFCNRLANALRLMLRGSLTAEVKWPLFWRPLSLS